MTGLKGRVDADSHIIESNSICRYLYVPSGRSLSQSLKFTKNKDSDTETLTKFEKLCKKLETTPFKNFKTIAKIELKEFLEKSKKEQIKLKK